MTLRQGILTLSAITLVQMVIAFIIPAGFNTPDEILYSLMAQNMAEHGSLTIENGYGAFPSPGLVLKFTVPHNGALYPQYPPFYAFIAAGFYLIAGLHGLLLLNALALVGVIYLTYRITQHLFTDNPATPILAVGILLLGTYVWPFSQAVWPHMLTLCFILFGCWMHLIRRHLLAGFMLGIACGIRVDALFAAPVLFLPLLFARPVAWQKTFTTALGLVLPLLLLACLNQMKFGSFTPFSYGTDGGSYTGISTRYVILLCVGVAALTGALGIHRLATRNFRLSIILAIVLPLAGCLLAFALMPVMFGKTLYGLWFNLVDIRFAALPDLPGALIRTDTGGVVYYGEFKRALLQSCPFIFLFGALPFLWPRFAAEKRHSFLWLMLVPASYLAVFSFMAWEGSFAYNMRYLLPALPFLAIAAAGIFSALCKLGGITLGRTHLIITCVVSLCIARMAFLSPGWSMDTREILANDVPLLLGIFTLLIVLIALPKGGNALRPLLPYALLPALLWCGITSAVLHFPQHNAIRGGTASATADLTPVIADNALVLGSHQHFAGLHFIKPHFRLATTAGLDEAAVRELITHHLNQGTHVYVSLGATDADTPKTLLTDIRSWGLMVKPLENPRTTPYTPRLVEILPGEGGL